MRIWTGMTLDEAHNPDTMCSTLSTACCLVELALKGATLELLQSKKALPDTKSDLFSYLDLFLCFRGPLAQLAFAAMDSVSFQHHPNV